MDKLVDMVLDYCGYTGLEVVRKSRGTYAGCNTKEFISLVLKYDSGSMLAKSENWGEQTFYRAAAAYLIPIFGKLNGGGETWGYVLLKAIEHKYCGSCSEIMPFTSFNKDADRNLGLHRLCKNCQSITNKAWYLNNRDTYHKQYLSEHLADYNSRNAKRRALLLQAIPSWADIDKIKDIYRTCPKGYHVDHIVPLNSPEVCGLHVENNLRHLPAQENISKSNKLIGGLA